MVGRGVERRAQGGKAPAERRDEEAVGGKYPVEGWERGWKWGHGAHERVGCMSAWVGMERRMIGVKVGKSRAPS